jgi:hypothetical protein
LSTLRWLPQWTSPAPPAFVGMSTSAVTASHFLGPNTKASRSSSNADMAIRKGTIVAFIQIIEYRTSKPGEVQAVADEWAQATEGKRKARRRVLCQDRDNDGRYFNIVFFDSHEDAMANSALPDTDRLSKKMMSFADGPPTFYNLDVVDDQE